MEVLEVGLPRWIVLGVFNDEMGRSCWFICGLLSKKSVGFCGCLREFWFDVLIWIVEMQSRIWFISKLSWRWAKALSRRWLTLRLSISQVHKLVHWLIPFMAAKLATQLLYKCLQSHVLLTIRRRLFDSAQFLKRLLGRALASRTGTSINSIPSSTRWYSIFQILYDLISHILLKRLKIGLELSYSLLVFRW